MCTTPAQTRLFQQLRCVNLRRGGFLYGSLPLLPHHYQARINSIRHQNPVIALKTMAAYREEAKTAFNYASYEGMVILLQPIISTPLCLNLKKLTVYGSYHIKLQMY